jgi:hypothetical protein
MPSAASSRGIAHDAVDHRLDVGAVVADEHHQQALRPARAGQAVAPAVDPRQVEIDGRAAEIADRRRKADHALSPEFGDNRPMIPRFFCPFPLHPGATVELAAEAAHHALKVLRVGAGDTAILFDGRGGQWHATLHPAGKSLRATWTRFEDADAEPPLMLTLVQALPAGDKMDFVVQKAVELGVSCASSRWRQSAA